MGENLCGLKSGRYLSSNRTTSQEQRTARPLPGARSAGPPGVGGGISSRPGPPRLAPPGTLPASPAPPRPASLLPRRLAGRAPARFFTGRATRAAKLRRCAARRPSGARARPSRPRGFCLTRARGGPAGACAPPRPTAPGAALPRPHLGPPPASPAPARLHHSA